MAHQALKESITIDLKAQRETNLIDASLHKKALEALESLSDDDWKDIDNMSTVEAADMVLEIARHK